MKNWNYFYPWKKLIVFDFRYDNRRRMGVELMILCMLTSPSLTSWEIPDKYQAQYFILDMLVSCRQRFQKPNAAAFWSKQSEVIFYHKKKRFM